MKIQKKKKMKYKENFCKNNCWLLEKKQNLWLAKK